MMQTDKRKVFVVHGRNKEARDSLFDFLRAIGLHPLEWSEVVTATGKASPYVGEVLEKGFSMVQAAVVLMTPDDEARLRERYQGKDEPLEETQLTPQPRPNVLLEAGMALGLFPNRTVIVEMGRLRPVSDIGGRHVIRMDNSSEKRQELAQRLQITGCMVNLTGTDWHKAGRFDLALASCHSRSAKEDAGLPKYAPVSESVMDATRRPIAVHLCEIVSSLGIHYHQGLSDKLVSPFRGGHANPFDLDILESFPDILDELRALPSGITRDKSTSDIAVDFYESVKWDLDQIQNVLTPRILQTPLGHSLADSLVAFDEAHRELRHAIIGHKQAVTHNVFPNVIELIEKARDLYRELLQAEHGQEEKKETRNA